MSSGKRRKLNMNVSFPPTTKTTTKKRQYKRNKYNQVESVKDLTEFKCIDEYGTLADVSSTNSDFFLLNGCAQGTSSDGRLGIRTLLKSVRVKYSFYDIAGTGRANDFCLRFMVFHDSQPHGTDPTFAELLTRTVAPYGSTSMPAITGKERFDIYYDKVHCVCAQEDGGTTPGFGEFYAKLNIPCRFNANTTGDIDDIEEGALFFMIMNDTATGTNGSVNVYWQSRVLFTDL